MPEYLIYFNQQWVGDHTEEWFRGRGPLGQGGGGRDQGCMAAVRVRGRAGGGGRPGLQRGHHQRHLG